MNERYTSDFDVFRESFPLHSAFLNRVDSILVEKEFNVKIPTEMKEFWDEVDAGYYGQRELCIFGRDNDLRNGIVSWNSLPHLRRLFPPPTSGGPLFFGDTCFGDQIGFRWEDDQCIPVFLAVDTMELFVMARSLRDLFASVLSDRAALIDLERLNRVENRLGVLPAGKHFAPIQSPLAGGDDSADNYHLTDPVVHIAVAVGIYEAVQKLPSGTPIKRIDLEFE